LQTKFRKRCSGGLQFLVAYTFSKSIDDVSSFSQPNFGVINATDPARVIQLGLKLYY
jgi:hypothetical protein